MPPIRNFSPLIYTFLVLAAFYCAAPAQEWQEPPRIAVYVTGAATDNERKALGARLLAALLNSGKYNGIAMSGSFAAEMDKEHQKLRGAAIDDVKACELGRRFAAEFVCVADITPVFGAYQITARIVNAETARIAHISTAESPLKTIDDLAKVSEQIAGNLLGAQSAPAAQAVPAAQPAPAPSEPAPAKKPTPGAEERFNRIFEQ
jgi:hypothetical protein